MGCGVLAWWGVERDPKVALIIAMGLITSAPVVIRWAQGCLDPFEPIVVIAVAIFVMCVARPIVELDQHLTPYAPLYNAPAGFIPAMVVDIVGTIVLYVGYFSAAGKRVACRIRPLSTAWDADRSMRFVVGLLVVGMLLESVFVAQIGLHTWIGLSCRTQPGEPRCLSQQHWLL